MCIKVQIWYLYVYMCIYDYMCVLCIYVYMCVYMCIYVCICYMCIYTYVYVCIYVYIKLTRYENHEILVLVVFWIFRSLSRSLSASKWLRKTPKVPPGLEFSWRLGSFEIFRCHFRGHVYKSVCIVFVWNVYVYVYIYIYIYVYMSVCVCVCVVYICLCVYICV